jgi:DNA-binding MarR family transcriptional regulator
MAEPAVAAILRRRNTILEGLELFRSANAPRSFTSFILFLYACENEGLSFSELAELAGMPVASASRLIRSLTGLEPDRGIEPALFQVEEPASDRRLKMIWLTEDGRAMRDALEGLIAAAHPIRSAI